MTESRARQAALRRPRIRLMPTAYSIAARRRELGTGPFGVAYAAAWLSLYIRLLRA